MEVWENEYPDDSEYSHFYSTYVEVVDKENITHVLNRQMHELYTLINTVPAEKAYYAYAPDKWTLKEVLGHMIECERVFCYRTMAISRGEDQSLPYMDQNQYMVDNNYNQRTLANLANEYLAVRVSTMHLLNSMTKEMIARKGKIGESEITVRALAFIIAGHERHHLSIISTKYLTD